MTLSYKDTIVLPKTSFSMKADLANREPEIAKTWTDQKIYERLRKERQGRELFVLHDGPPYANGHLHLGHALNKTLKDIVIRFESLQGKNAPFVPGWDCHGLPIEWKIEEKYRKEGKNKDDVPVLEFRAECRAFAEHWVTIQKEEFQRLGIFGEWQTPYLTMSRDAEAKILEELYVFLMDGTLYRGAKPVMWSVIEKTALAEAEVEYKDRVSPSIHVAFPIVKSTQDVFVGARAVIWTTTPWTLPGNRAIAYHPDSSYVLIRTDSGDKLIVAQELLANVCTTLGVTHHEVLLTFEGKALEGTICQHPLHADGYTFDVPLLAGTHVTMDQGTGLVHTAPGHGVEDFALGQQYGIEVPQTVGDDGHYYAHVPLVAGLFIFKAQEKIMEALTNAGHLLARSEIKHSYPHSWRSKAPLIYRTTAQWFISMEKTHLRNKALAAIDEVRWLPEQGKNRLTAMVAQRPDWCLSRQRTWGVPLMLFVNKETGDVLQDASVNQRIVDAVLAGGSDIWFEGDPKRFLAPDYEADDYEVISDILDVWFESGASHSYVLGQNPELRWPADLYLEGSDQHRGWFQSSLLTSCGTRGSAPYRTVLTHGFIVDAQGRKMSKSEGNALTLEEILKDYGADIIRLWVVSSNYTEDLRVGREILTHLQETYRRIRNTFRYLLGNLDGFSVEKAVPYVQLPSLERWVLHRLYTLDKEIRVCLESYDLHEIFVKLHQFCSTDLSAFYFDIRKDALYCDSPLGDKRLGVQTTLHYVFEYLVRWFAPLLSFTTEEAYRHRHGADESVHLTELLAPPSEWQQDGLMEKWQSVRQVRSVVTAALEKARVEGMIGSSLQASVALYATDKALPALTIDEWEDVCITSGVTFPEGSAPDGSFEHVLVSVATGEKCARCWRVLPDVGRHRHAHTCQRCSDALEATPALKEKIKEQS